MSETRHFCKNLLIQIAISPGCHLAIPQRLPKPCVAIYPTHSARRISTQRSCFTIHGSDEAALESLTGEPEAHITKVTIPRAEVPEQHSNYQTE